MKMSEVYFVHDEFINDIEYFETEEKAREHFERITNDLQGEDGWPQEVLDGAIKIGVVLFESCMENKRPVPLDDDGEPVDNSFDYLCDIGLAEVENPLTSRIEQLEVENLKLRTCVKFFADEVNWHWLNQISGQRARKTLAEIKSEGV